MRAAYVILLFGLILTFVGFLRLRENVLIHDQLRFERLVTLAQNEINARIVRCVDQMYNMRALFVATPTVSSEEWDRYIATLSIQEKELGIRSLGYIEMVPRADKDEFLKRRRADTDVNFAIKPEGERPVYYPVVYIGVFGPAGLNGRGLDHGIQPDRVEAIKTAIDKNKPSITKKVYFLTPDGTHTNTGVVLYQPVYQYGSEINTVEQRRKAVKGLIYLVIRPPIAFKRMLGSSFNQVDIEIFDGRDPSPKRLLYNSDRILRTGHPELNPYLEQQTNVVVLNHHWTVHLSSLPEFNKTVQQYLPWVGLAGGIVASLLLFGISWVQINARLRAENYAAELHRSETALAAEKERLAVTLHSIGEGVITTDTSEKIISINEAGEFLTGWPRNEAEGKKLGEVFRAIHDQTQEPCADVVEKALQTRAMVERENHILLITRDGTKRAIATNTAPIRGKGGNIVGAVLAFRDVTEKQKAEAQMLTESKLESVGLLAGGIAHDFNNMLAGILGNISVARTPNCSKEETARLLADVEKTTLRAKDLTQQLLTFAKGGSPIKKPILLHELIRETCQFALHGSNVQCDYSLAEDAKPVEADEGQLRQILNNLVINARQAMPHGGKMEVRLENVDLSADAVSPLQAGKYVRISVKDHGSGISADHLPRIFEPYFTTKKEGTGLGLATVYSVVRKHDGQIKVESKPGVGTTFDIYLPALMKPLPPLPVVTKAETFSGHGRVLVMDDETDVRKMLSTMLRKFGYDVETANDGREAIECYKTARAEGKPFDLVIMDLTIPNGMGGREAARWLRELDPQVKVIASSGYSFDPVMANHRDYGFCGVIPKPYRVEELGRVLGEVMGKESPFNTAGATSATAA